MYTVESLGAVLRFIVIKNVHDKLTHTIKQTFRLLTPNKFKHLTITEFQGVLVPQNAF